MMKEWKCLACEYRFCSENDIPYCPACENEWLEEIEDESKFRNTKTYKKKKCQAILKKGFISEEDKKFLLELLKHHPDYDLKIGSGISNFFIKKTRWNNNGFYIKRIDGTETDFSYLSCLNPKSKIQNIKEACRSAISEDMMKISRRGYIAHHVIPFIDIFNLWIKDKDINSIKLNDTVDNCVVTCFSDEKLSQNFRNFHNSIAKIKEVSLEEHKKIHYGDKNGSN